MNKLDKLKGMMRGADRAVVRPGETGRKPVDSKQKAVKRLNRLKAAAKARAKLRGKTKTMMERFREQTAPKYGK
tara:strand:- start:2307 stop:2528 length:222 start_codon:yes stop_codon:yes gene_type:complete